MIRKVLLVTLLCTTIGISLFGQTHNGKKSTKRPLSLPSLTRGKIVYTRICIACHMADGAGVPMMNPPIIKTSYVLGDKTTLIKIVLNGFKEDVEINGQKYSNNMTPHNDLTDMQISDVLTFVRKSFGNNASAVTASEVKKVRAANKS